MKVLSWGLGIALSSVLVATLSFAAEFGTPAANQLFGHITSDRVLTYAAPGPVYELIGDLTVDDGATLTIERGVKLIATANSDFLASGADRQRVEIAVQGTLFAPAGADSVVIRSTAGMNAWYGVRGVGFGTVNLNDVLIQGAEYAVEGAAGPIALNNVSFDQCNQCVWTSSSTTMTGVRSARCNAGIECLYGASLQLSGGALVGTGSSVGSGLVVHEMATAHVSNVALSNWQYGAHALNNSEMHLSGCTVNGVTYGLIFDAYAAGSIHTCGLNGFPSGYMGMQFSGIVDVSAPDSLAPIPNSVANFHVGAALWSGPPIQVDHFLVSHCVVGVITPDVTTTLNYCTFADNSYCAVQRDAYQHYFASLLNSIIVSPSNAYPASGYNLAVDCSDVWGGVGFTFTHFGTRISSFNPYFVPDNTTYHLSSASFFHNFSCSGGQIGAYGPGPAGPTPVMSASVISADAADGAAKIRWYVGAGGEKASVVRKLEGGEWEPKSVLLRDGSGYVTLEDRDVTPGTRYGYAIGTQNEGQIGIDGEVWVTVEQHMTALSRPSISPNPSPDGWNVAFAAPTAAAARIEVLDVSGRLLVTQDASPLTIGRNTAYVSSSKLSPGIYWIRVRQAGHETMARAVKVE